jgi:hypothetical protein
MVIQFVAVLLCGFLCCHPVSSAIVSVTVPSGLLVVLLGIATALGLGPKSLEGTSSLF